MMTCSYWLLERRRKKKYNYKKNLIVLLWEIDPLKKISINYSQFLYLNHQITFFISFTFKYYSIFIIQLSNYPYYFLNLFLQEKKKTIHQINTFHHEQPFQKSFMINFEILWSNEIHLFLTGNDVDHYWQMQILVN
jgi:hypothetical protein